MDKKIKDSDSSVLYRCNQKYFDKALFDYGLGYSNLIFLLEIYENEGISLNELAIQGAFDKGTITKSIQKLEQLDYVTIKVNEADKRGRLLYTSDKANSIIPKLYLLRQEWDEYLTKDIDPNEIENYLNILSKIINKARSYNMHSEDESIKIYEFDKLSLNDYVGKTCATLYVGGCNFKCPYCNKKNIVFLNKDNNEIDIDSINDYLDKRKNVLEAITISGGEPLIQNGLKEYIKSLKAKKYLVKIDTNGSNYKLLKELVDDRLVDYVSMDVKNTKDKYASTIGLESYDLSDIEKCIKYLKDNHVNSEFKITLTKEFHENLDTRQLGKWLEGSKKLILQKFNDGDCIKDGLHSLNDEEMLDIKDKLSSYIDEVIIKD